MGGILATATLVAGMRAPLCKNTVLTAAVCHTRGISGQEHSLAHVLAVSYRGPGFSATSARSRPAAAPTEASFIPLHVCVIGVRGLTVEPLASNGCRLGARLTTLRRKKQ